MLAIVILGKGEGGVEIPGSPHPLEALCLYDLVAKIVLLATPIEFTKPVQRWAKWVTLPFFKEEERALDDVIGQILNYVR